MSRAPQIRGSEVRAHSAPAWVADPAVPRLFEALAGRCRGRTLVIGCGTSGLVLAIRRRERQTYELQVNGADGSYAAAVQNGQLPRDRRFKTVVLIGVLERLSGASGERLIEKAWAHVKPGGHLLVAVSNEDCLPDPERLRRFDRRGLKKMLRPLGRFRLVGEQPFKWLVADVRKSPDGRTQRNRAREARHGVTADLCRGAVIELGCGAGDLAGLIRARGLSVVGVDINAEKIEAARARYSDITFIHSDILDLNPSDAEFDTVVLAEVLEHVAEEPGRRILERASRLASAGGRLIVSVPNEDCIPHPNHVRLFDRRCLEAMLRPFGTPKLVCEQPYKWLMMYVEMAS